MKIGILGLAGAGKDTVADIIKQHSMFEIDRYAAPLKRAAQYTFGDTFDERTMKNYERIWYKTSRADRGLSAAYRMCHELAFSDKEVVDAGYHYAEVLNIVRTCSPRQYQQLLGTEVIRKVRPLAFSERIKKLDSDLVVPDVRFGNELLDINLFIYRPNAEYYTHESEALAQSLQNQVDSSLWQGTKRIKLDVNGTPVYLILNTGSMEHLQREVVSTIAHLKAI